MRKLILSILLAGCASNPAVPALGEQVQVIPAFADRAIAELSPSHAPVIGIEMFVPAGDVLYQKRTNGVPPRIVVLHLEDQTTRYVNVDCSTHEPGGPEHCDVTVLR
jgi:hypothetical protein